jgi:cytochrome c peroxidase
LAVVPDYKTSQIWPTLMRRLLAIPAYVDLFRAAYPEVPVEALGFQHAANALAAYQAQAFTFEDSPFDRYLHGDRAALSPEAKQGALLFYGKAGCATCHATGLLTDQGFHNMAVPQVGPGKGRDQPLDYGRARETGSDCDLFAFRTPPLRNVAITGPWMHNGAYTTLEAAVRHQLQAVESLKSYDPSQLSPLLKDTCQEQSEVIAAILATADPYAQKGVGLSEAEIRQLIAFLEALTSPSALHLEGLIPASVPSGLPVGGNIQFTTSHQDSSQILEVQP